MARPIRGIVYNALPLDARGGGVSTYIRELLGAMTSVVDGPLAAAVRPSGLAELPPGVTPLVKRESSGVARALTGAMGFGPCQLVHGLDVDLPLGRNRHCRSPPSTTWPSSTSVDLPPLPGGRRTAARAPRPPAGRCRRGRLGLHRRSGPDSWWAVRRRGHRLAPGTGMAPPSEERVDEVRARYRLPDRFVLHVGNIEPRKDIPTLAQACRAASHPPRPHRTQPLGPPAPDREPSRSGTCRPTTFPVCTAPPPWSGYASRYEGFGLPPIEAMACGAAVVTTPVPAVTELVGDGAELFRPGDVDGLTETVRQLVHDEPRRAELAGRGSRRVAGLSWLRTARRDRRRLPVAGARRLNRRPWGRGGNRLRATGIPGPGVVHGRKFTSVQGR